MQIGLFHLGLVDRDPGALECGHELGTIRLIRLIRVLFGSPSAPLPAPESRLERAAKPLSFPGIDRYSSGPGRRRRRLDLDEATLA